MTDEAPPAFLAGIFEASKLQDAQLPALPVIEASTNTDRTLLPSPAPQTSASPQPNFEELSPKEVSSTLVEVKTEVLKTPREATPLSNAGNQEISRSSSLVAIDEDSLKAISKLKNEHGLRSTKASPPTPSLEPPKPVNRKRPAPKSVLPVTKKSITSLKKQPAKKRKVEGDNSRLGTPASSHRSITPASSWASRTPNLHGANSKARKSQSGTPATGSSPAPIDVLASPDSEDDHASTGEDGNDVFCICRRPDNHTWMIACDGGCEDWFHGKCINIKEEDGVLIDKYICPNCAAKNRGVTTWKPMCRALDCRQPARLKKGSASKYCTDECGLNFFKLAISNANSQIDLHTKKPNRRKSKVGRKSSTITTAAFDGSDSESTDLGPRGGRIRPRELKTLVNATNDINAFRSLGIGMPSPPASVSPGSSDVDALYSSTTLNGLEKARIATIRSSTDALRIRHTLIRDRERFIIDVHENAKRYAEREGLKIKDVCGFDSRIVWSEDEFVHWRDGDAAEAGDASVNEDGGKETANDTDNGMSQPNLQINEEDIKQEQNQKGKGLNKIFEFMCLRKRCERHRFWQKVAMSDLRCEVAAVVNEMQQLEAEERDIRERAIIRYRQTTDGVYNGGTVEIIGDG